MIVLGRITAPFGVKGWVNLHTFGDDPASWLRMKEWWLGGDAAASEWQAWRIADLKPHGKGWVAHFEGCDDRSAAERLEGMYVGAPRQALPEPDADEYYWSDLVGLAVANGQGEALGRVQRLIETGANTVLVVEDGDGAERLLPFVAAVVKKVDVPAGRIEVDWGKDW